MVGLSNESRVQAALEKVDAAHAGGQLAAGSVENIKRWLSEPCYAEYLPRLLELIDGDRFEELDTLFWEVIRFGTGGRRGLMGELGSATINERTIAESAHGLATYSKQQRGASGGRAVVACDTRNRSAEFSKLAATTLAANGFHVFLFDSFRSTPLLSFSVRHLECDVGVMISASHNPSSDNGFKAYWSHGGQVVPPHDQGIIDCVYHSGDIPSLDFDRAVADGKIEIVGEVVDRAYLDAVGSLSFSDSRDVPAIFTPLHGVGETSVYKVLVEAGFAGVEIFEPQRDPDGNFSNVPDQLPNPERPEVFGPAIEQANRNGAELILASDPDADRLGVAVKNSTGTFTVLTGNQVGALLADYILRKRKAGGTLTANHFVVETLVTTPLISAIAKSYGVRVIDDLLVGFKYIGETMDCEGPDKFLFGAEESLGYLSGSYCHDKDAAIAGLYIMELAAELRAQERTLLDQLDTLYCKHGYFVEGQRSEVCTGSTGKEQIDKLMSIFRKSPPVQLAGVTLNRVRDYAQHEVRSLPTNKRIEELPQPDGDLLFFDSIEEHRTFSIAVRPSGTEPKIKFYLFGWGFCDNPESLDRVKQQANSTLKNIEQSLAGWISSVD